ncbi:uncharacterized protein FOMMEDRAFT_16102 [Fomitiporia mediterranea MF3/22]|uniref:uncharacterized protein n=1 Tax=Fomitiporia mediterranea (strain MF3/22) TaxID=694068 RepID=UPI0004408D9A|nr:uncharacterized protein FOMMEDRAFT_16102 [Fomitiporia mediterranea MF3/22]EJD07434.1 hypothetical protein FOMMEDRAFT_16102 [Fomitiporia mediterranea MF3/22]
MSVDLTDPNITSVYDDIIKNRDKDWLLLTYGQSRDKLSLLESGIGTFNDLCGAVPRSEDVYFGFCRERDGDNNYFALIAFVPEGVSGVKRARALVHSRAVGSLFKAANISMNVSNLDVDNTSKLRERLQLGPSYIPRLAPNVNHPVQRSASMPTEPRSSPEPAKNNMKGLPQSPRARVVASESQARKLPSLSHDLPRIPSEFDEDPPATPPKDISQGRSASAFVKSASTGSTFDTSHQRVTSFMSDGDEVVISPGSLNNRGSNGFSLPRSPPRVVSPSERARLRLEAQKKREAEELQAQREEAERQERLKRQKEETLRQAQEEEERRRARLEEEKQRALAERARREREAQLEEEHRLQELETRKRQEKERRMLQAKRLDEERQEAERRAAEAAKRREEQRRASDVMRKQRMKEIQAKFAQAGRLGSAPALLSGAVTVQTSVSNSWKRRFFELKSDSLIFYRDSQDKTVALDVMTLTGGRVRAIKEPNEGYDELEAIPYSFVVEFTDGEGPWCMFCDSSEDKDILMSLLSQTAGLS